MPKMIIMQGLPASGKSTRAKAIIEESGGAVRINKDLLRTMLHFDKFNGRNESLTREASQVLAVHFLQKKMNVIIDDTNLNAVTLHNWVDLARKVSAKHEIIQMLTPWLECVIRDSKREKPVGNTVIKNMALWGGLVHLEKVIICDIDGTIADTSHRLHFVRKPDGEKKDWKGFFEAAVNDPVREDVRSMLISYFDQGYTIVFMSGRPDNYKEQTLKWLNDNYLNFAFTVIMRKANDKRDDTIVKKEMLDMYFPNKTKIHKVIDDRPSVIRMWRENGLDVIDVGKGEEF